MGVYSRFKRSPEGFRSLVELVETTPSARRKKMIEVGQQEDPEFTSLVLEYVITFETILSLPEMELAELLSKAPARVIALATKNADDAVKTSWLRCAPARIAAEVKDLWNMNVGLAEVGGAQLKLIEATRQLEKKGLIRTKKIPDSMPTSTNPSKRP